jgi:tetratricopeptide (TPR) repeat protein
MPLCSQCKAPLDQSEKFCGSCGNPTPAAGPASGPATGQTAAADDPWVGQVVGERWQINQRLASGAFGWTYAVNGVADGSVATVKLLRQTTEQDPGMAERFATVLERVSQLNDYNTAVIYDYAEIDGGFCYIVSDLATGPSLADAVTAGPMAVERAVAVAHQIAASLASAHSAGVLHGCIKPSNIFLEDRDGVADTVRVVDFGLVDVMGAHWAKQRPSNVEYMAPEILKDLETDYRADVYALGAVLYHMLAGRPPFVGDGPQVVLNRALTQKPGPPSIHAKVPGVLDKIVLKALEKNPQNRQAGAAEFKQELEAAAAEIDAAGGAAAATAASEPKSRRSAGGTPGAAAKPAAPAAEGPPLKTVMMDSPGALAQGAPATMGGAAGGTAGAKSTGAAPAKSGAGAASKGGAPQPTVATPSAAGAASPAAAKKPNAPKGARVASDESSAEVRSNIGKKTVMWGQEGSPKLEDLEKPAPAAAPAPAPAAVAAEPEYEEEWRIWPILLILVLVLGGGAAVYVYVLGDPLGVFYGSRDDGDSGGGGGGGGKKHGDKGKGDKAKDDAKAAEEARKKEVAAKLDEARAFMKSEKWAQAERVLGEIIAGGGDTGDAASLKVKAGSEKAVAEKYEDFITSIDGEDWLGAYEIIADIPKDSFYYEKTKDDREKVTRRVVLLNIDICIRHIEAEEFGKASAECQAAADIDPGSPTIVELKKLIAAKNPNVPDDLRTKPKVTIGEAAASTAEPATAAPEPEPPPGTAGASGPDKGGDKGPKGTGKPRTAGAAADDGGAGGAAGAAKTFLAAAAKDMGKGKYDLALKDADAAVKASPKYGAAHMARARALDKLGRTDEALEAAHKATDIESGSGVYLSELAQMYYNANKLDDAIATAEKAVDLKGGYEGYRVLGRVYKKKGMTGEAVNAFKKWLTLSPSKDKVSTRDIVEVLIRKSPPPKKTSGAKCNFVEDCDGMELCDGGTCG